MTRRERETHVRLDAMSEEQVELVRDEVIGQLIGKAADLHLLNKYADPRRAIREVAALGRLAFWLEDGKVAVPDRPARELMARIGRELEESDQDLLESAEEAVARHEALRAFVAYLADDDASEGR
jgi:hypothetical protein